MPLDAPAIQPLGGQDSTNGPGTVDLSPYDPIMKYEAFLKWGYRWLPRWDFLLQTIHLGGSPWLRKPSCPHRMAPKMCKITYKSPTQCGFCGVFNSRGKGNLDPWQKPAKAEKVIWVRTRIAGHITHCVIAGNSRTSRNFPF